MTTPPFQDFSSPDSAAHLAGCRYCDPRANGWHSRLGGAGSAAQRSVKFARRDQGTGHEGVLQMNERTTWVSQAFGVLAMLAAVAFVPTDAAAEPFGPKPRVICCIPQKSGPVECGQLTPDNCTRIGGTSMGPGSCAHNPCLSSSTTTTTTGAVTTSSTSTSTSAPVTTSSTSTSTSAPVTTSSTSSSTSTSTSAPVTTSSTSTSTSTSGPVTTSSTSTSTSTSAPVTTSSTSTSTSTSAPVTTSSTSTSTSTSAPVTTSSTSTSTSTS